ncbi:MAG: hypothetical protein GWN58_58465 [Anaerolineae bacterium]|nr:hypothetical protein [Anaerolineae bacterium]
MGWEQAQRAIDALTQQGASEETLQRASLLKAQMAEKQAAAELAAVNAMAGSIHRKVVTKRAQGRGRGVARAAEKRLELINKFPQLFERREVSPENTPVIPGSRLVDPRRGLTTTERRQGAEIYGNAVQALSDLREYQDSLDSASLRERKDAQDQIIEGLSDSEPGILTPFASLARNIVDPDAKRVVRNAYTVARGVALTQNPGGRISDNDVLQGFMQLVQATERGAVQTIDKVANRWKRDAQSRLRSLNQQVPEDAFDSFATSGTEKVK